MPRTLRFVVRLSAVLAVLLVLATLAVWTLLRGSLATLDGDLTLPELSAPVTVERDELGTVTIRAAHQVDAARALGYVHAQERYFEMDLMRRSAAGELAALFGKVALARDKRVRVHRMRARALDNLEAIAGDQLPVLQAYRDGVNAGLADLHVRPWPYLLLGAEPEPWQLADTALVGYAMFFDLQDEDNARELALWKIRQVVPPALYRLIAADGTEWDAPLMGGARGNVPLPGPDELVLRELPHAKIDLASLPPEPLPVGSNNFAVAGALTRDGRAIVADDMHLGLRAPNLWFRARLQYTDARAPGGRVDVAGVTLPGIPGVVVGSNGHVAWGFTNSYGDWADWVRPCNDAPDKNIRCLSPDQALGQELYRERIEIKGGEPVVLEVHERFGHPVMATDLDGTEMSLAWAAHAQGALNLGLADMATAGSLEQGLQVAGRSGIPTQNLVIGDKSGRIAWSIIGAIPRIPRAEVCDRTIPSWNLPTIIADRVPRDGSGMVGATIDPDSTLDTGYPADPLMAKVCAPWGVQKKAGWISDRPAAPDPAEHRLWTANARVTDGKTLRLIGDGGYDLGARAKQIRDALFARERFTETDLLAIQLDDRALLMERWWRQLRDVLAGSDDAALQPLEAASREWEGRASIDSASYRLARAFREQVLDRGMAGLLAPAKAALGDDFVMPRLSQREGVIWELITQRPANLLPPDYASWDALLRDAARAVAADLAKHSADLVERTWGERNTAAICHPLAGALPEPLQSALCMPREPLPGDSNMPRVQGPDFGASERMVVAPGHEEDGIFHMPGGQSGHPLSPFWGAGHEAWARGEATPFLPGTARHKLTLNP